MAENLAKQVPATRAKGASKSATAEVGRRERNKQEKRARIIAAAKELFGSKGFADTTTQEIAEKADIGTGTLFLYAKSKEELLVMVFSGDMIEQAQNAFLHLPATGSLVDKLMHVFGYMIEYHEQDKELSKALLKEITILTTPGPRRDIAMLMRCIYGGISDILVAGQKIGVVREGVDTELAAEILFSIYYLTLLGWISDEISKPRFMKRLREKLTTGVEGLLDPAGSAAERKPVRKA